MKSLRIRISSIGNQHKLTAYDEDGNEFLLNGVRKVDLRFMPNDLTHLIMDVIEFDCDVKDYRSMPIKVEGTETRQ